MFKPALLASVLACTLPSPAFAISDADMSAELAKLRAEFDQKLHALQTAYEARLRQLEASSAPISSDVAASPMPVATAATAANPEISLILQGGYAQRKAGERRPSGFLQDAGIGAPARGFSLNDAELSMAANIDPYFRGLANVILTDAQASVEEAWFQTISLDHGLTLKGGRFISGIGYANEQHPHAWAFADNNLMYQTLFGEHFVQDGVQLKWLAPTEFFLEFGAELGSGTAFPGSAVDRNGVGARTLFGHIGGDVGESSSWRAGLSRLSARPHDRVSRLLDMGGIDADTQFSGQSNIWIADFVWKWAPDGNQKVRNFKFQTEYFRRSERGELTFDPAGINSTDAYRARQTGWYAQGVYQFMPRWRVGLRYDCMHTGSLDYAANNANLPVADYSPKKWSLMTDFAPSEFSLFRLQLARDHAMQGNPDNSQVSLQYIYSLGAHGAHKF